MVLLKLLTSLWREGSTPDYSYLGEGSMRRTGFSASTGPAKEKDICGTWYVLEIQLAVLRLTHYRVTDVAVRVVPAPTSSYRRVSNLLDLLDAHVRPGVTEAEFKTLFVKCEECRLILTRRAYRRHICNSTEEN
jgi:hypothetical protein